MKYTLRISSVFPKTDYTYSQKSQCRYEIAPGVMAMPNMSRRSIHSDTSSTHGSIPSTSQQNLSQSSQLLGESSSLIGRESVGKELSVRIDNWPNRMYEIIESMFCLKQASDDLLLRSPHPDSVARAKMYKTTHVEQFSSRREVIYSNSGDASSFDTLRERWALNSHLDRQEVIFTVVIFLRFLGDSYGSSKASHRYEPLLQADSDVDIDDTITTVDGHRRLYRERQQKELNIFMRIYTSVVTYVVTSYTSVKNYVGLGETRRRYQSPSAHSYRQQEGIIPSETNCFRSYVTLMTFDITESRWRRAWQSIDHVLHYLYSLFVSVLFLDTWLLSRAEPLRERIPDRRTKLCWIVLIPLLLLGGEWYCNFYFIDR